MIVSINQPAYLPWLGYFHRIAISELHVVLDDVQFEKNSFTNRNKIRTKDGSCWLTVPVKTKGRFGNLPINELEIAGDPRWTQKHWATLRMNYARAEHFEEYAPFLEMAYARQWTRLADLVQTMTAHQLDVLGIHTPLRLSSELAVDGCKNELILNLCRAVGASTYLSGPLGRDYLDKGAFDKAGIQLAYHDYKHPVYDQAYAGFEPYMAAVDLILNHGARSREVLMAENVSPLEPSKGVRQ